MGSDSRKLGMNHAALGQFIRFSGVGGIGTGAHYLTLAALKHVGMNLTLATSIGAVIGAVLNYWLNYHITFRSQMRHSIAACRFFAIAAVGWLLNALVFYLLSVKAGQNVWPAQIITTGFVLLWNFTGNRLWTFGDTPND